MKKILPIVASISTLIIAFSFAYYFVFFLPSKEKAKQELETQKLLQGESEQFVEEEKLEEEQETASERLQVFKDCEVEAEKRASEALADKIESAKSAGLGSSEELSFFEKTVEKGFYLKDDYSFAYENCLRSHGVKY